MLLGRNNEGSIYVFERPVRLLVVDDDPIMCEFARAQLSHEGGEIVVAGDGEEAWSVLQGEQDFDLVLTDLEMPRMNGFGLVQAMRSSSRHAQLPVVVITSRDDMFAIDRAYEIGATSFAVKPLNWRLLGHQLRYVLRASRMESEIRWARDEAQRAARLKNSLLALLQHETRTPLHAIIGFSELLRPTSTDAAGGDYVENVLRAAHELNETLQRIFHFAQIASGSLALACADEPVVEAIRSAVASVRRTAAARAVAVEADCGGEFRAHVDIRQVSIALRELLANAVAHSPAGGVVRVECGLRDGEIVVEIADRGCGLDAQTLAECQRPFFQGDDPMRHSAAGLGLGLPIARRIAEMHAGRLELSSTQGEGTLVRLVLPAAPAAPREAVAEPVR